MSTRSMAVLAALLVLAVLTGCSLVSEPQTNLEEGMPATDFRLRDFEGKTWELSQLRGSVVVVNFWATWCPPCREEMPSLSRLYEKYRSRDDFEVLGILYHDLPEKASEYVSSGGFRFPILHLDNRVIDDYGVTGVPETYIVDKKGILRKIAKGPVEFDGKDSLALIEQLLNEPAPSQRK